MARVTSRVRFMAASFVLALAAGGMATATANVPAVGGGSPAAVTPAAAPKVEIKGTLGARARGFSVFLVSSDGQTVSVKSKGTTGAFRLLVAKSLATGSTLHLVGKDGRYAGPIVLDVDKVTAKGRNSFFAHLRLAGVDANLHAVSVPVGARYAVSAQLGEKVYLRDAVRADNEGRPFGAGRSGLVRKPAVITAAELRALSGKLAKSKRADDGSAANTDPGQDLDGDGLPNFVDVDDNGNTSLDLSDPNSGATAGLSTWSDLRISQNTPFNVHVGSVNAGQVATYVGTPGYFSTVFFVDQLNLTQSTAANAIDYVYVNCGDLDYCGGDAPTAVADDRVTNPGSSQQVAWETFRGGAYAEQGTTAPQEATTGISPVGTGNALQAGFRNEDHGQGSQVYTNWMAMMNPNTISDAAGGADTFDKMHVGDVYDLTYRVRGETADRHRAMTLSPFAATVPGVATINGADATASENVGLQSDGTLDLTFYRPQRLTVDGEAGTFMDLGGLYWGVIIMAPGGGSEYGCNPDTYYSGLSGLVKKPGFQSSNQADSLWPFVDTTKQDVAVSENLTLGFTVDVEQCIRDHNGGNLPTGQYGVNLTAAGQFMTGGANRATTALRLTIGE